MDTDTNHAIISKLELNELQDSKKVKKKGWLPQTDRASAFVSRNVRPVSKSVSK